MNGEELEYNICQYLDGTLASDERAALETLLQHDEAAQQLLVEHRRLDAAMKEMSPMPQLPWDQLAQQFAGAITADSEQLEAAVVRYVDGDLAATDRAVLEERLSTDPHAATLMGQHGRLLAGLRSMPQPRLLWKNLAAHLYEAVAEIAEPKPIKLFGPWVRTVGGLAIAACVMLVSGLALHQRLHSGNGQIGFKPQPARQAIASIQFDTDASKPAGAAVTDISITAGGNAANAMPAEYADGIVVVQPSRSVIATGAGPVQDIQMPY